MKVLFTASTFPRWEGDELPDFVWQQIRFILQVCPEVEATVLAPHDRGAARLEHWDGVTIRRFRYFFPERLQKLAYPAIWPNLRKAPWLSIQVPLFLLSEFFATLAVIRRERPDIVYSHWFVPQGLACGLAALVSGTPHVFTSHSRDVSVLRKLPGIGAMLVRFFVRKAYAVTVVSERSCEALETFFDADSWRDIQCKVDVVPMGVDLSAWESDLASVRTPTTSDGRASEILLFVGRLAEKKGVSYLLAALAREPLRSRDVLLIVAGDGPLLTALEDQARALGISDRVEFVGYVTGARKARVFNVADVVVVPSIVTEGGDAEGLPVVLIEALAAGKLCVATDASNASEVMTGNVDGFIVPEKSAEALARVIDRVLSLSASEKNNISEQARKTGSAYDWPTIAERHAEHLFSRRHIRGQIENPRS